MKTKFYADLCGNTNKDINRTRKLIEGAKRAGCDGVKFQLFTANTLYAPNLKGRDYDWIRANELPEEFIPQIAEICKEVDIEFGCSPFSMHAVDILTPYVDFFKMASYEILRLDLIEACVKTKKPFKFATGLAIDAEIANVFKICEKHGNYNINIFHCVSSYPVLPENCGLRKIHDLGKFGYRTGWSDHSKEPGVIYGAINQGASVIEFHLDLDDGLGTEYGMGHCWKVSEIKDVIDDVRVMEEAVKFSVHNEFNSQRLKRADPFDGLRPYKFIREYEEIR